MHHCRLPTSANYYMLVLFWDLFRPQTAKLTSLTGCTYCQVTGWNFGMGVLPMQVTEFTNKHDFMIILFLSAAAL